MVYEIEDTGSHTERVSRKRQTRLRHIVREALSLAALEGGDALTLQQLAARLDYTPGALYRYFPSKEALIAELQRVVLAWLSLRTERCVSAAASASPELEAGPLALLGVLTSGLAFEHFGHSSPVEFGLLSMHLNEPGYQLPEREAGRVFDAAAELLGQLAERLDHAADAGILDPGDATERALALWAALQGAMQTRKLARSAPGQIDPRRVARSLLATLIVGWGANARATADLLERADAAVLAEETSPLDELLAIDS
jgi:AcrR family transcriptional regulator